MVRVSHRRFPGIAILCACAGVLLLAICLSGWINLHAQGKDDPQDRVIEKKSNSAVPNEPVEITVVRTKNNKRRFGEKFKDDDEWVQGLTVTVKNISRKNVTYINVRLSFERPEESEGAAEPTLVHSLVFGSKDPRTSKRSQVLAPGSSIDISLPDRSYAALKVALRKIGYPASINHLKLYLTQVSFDDDTMWANGYWFRRDPAIRDKWIPVEKAMDSLLLTLRAGSVSILMEMANPISVAGPRLVQTMPGCLLIATAMA